MAPQKADEYTVGWICPLEDDLFASTRMLDQKHDRLPKDSRDTNTYRYGSVAGHNVVMAGLPVSMGESSATDVANNMWRTFRYLRFVLLVGIGGGVPSQDLKDDIHLGDVVVSQPTSTYPGIVQWDMGKRYPDGKFQRIQTLDKPPKELLGALQDLSIRVWEGECTLLDNLKAIKNEEFQYPDDKPDNLFEANYRHVEGQHTCAECDKSMLVRSKKRATPKIHRGTIASGNIVMKDAETRDKVSRDLNGVLCFEMEAAGLDNVPCLCIRGISNYCDSHKNDGWQYYAAATAASCAKEILHSVSPEDVGNMEPLLTVKGQFDKLGICEILYVC